MKMFAFDCDETLECSRGPVTKGSVLALFKEGHAVGICGNWAQVCAQWPDWHRFISFLGTIGIPKAFFLAHTKQYIPSFDDYVMVGNSHRLGQVNSPDDETAARDAGWRFILAQDFARGER